MQSYLRSYIITLVWDSIKECDPYNEREVFSLGSIPQRMSGEFR